MNEQIIYKHYSKGIRTGWEYTLSVIPAGTVPLSSPTIIEIPYQAVKLISLDAGFDDKPIGLPKKPLFELEFDLNYFKNDSRYTVLNEIIQNPADERGFGTFGTLYILEASKGSHTDILFLGCQKEGIEGDWDIEALILKVKVDDLIVSILEQMSMSELVSWIKSSFEPVDYIKSAKFYNFVNNVGGGAEKAIAFERQDSSYYYWFIQIDKIFSRMTTRLIAYFNVLIRNYTSVHEEFAIGRPITKFYKQLYNWTGNLGAELSFNHLYLLVAVAPEAEGIGGLPVGTPDGNTTRWYGGLFDDRDKDSLAWLNATLWDFLKDVYENTLTKAILGYDLYGLITLPVYANGTVDVSGSAQENSYNTNDPVVIDTADLGRKKLQIAKDRVKNVTSSMAYTNDMDLDKYETANPNSKNSKGFNLPIIMNNAPEAVGTIKMNTSVLNVRQTQKGEENYYKLFYLDTTINSTAMIRVHEFCKTNLTSSFSTQDLTGGAFSAFNQQEWIDIEKFTEMSMAMQQETCLHKIHAECLLEILSKKNIAELEIDIPMNYKTALPGSFWYRAFMKTYTIDLSIISSNMSYLGDKWVALTSKIDLKTEKVSLKLLNRTF